VYSYEGPQAMPARLSGKGGLERRLRRSDVKKVEMKGEAGREVEQGSTAFS
jgi:hypothetical protein